MLADVDALVQHDAPIGAELTWYGLGGRADTLVRPRSVAALQTLLKRCRESGVTLRVLGSGANLLVADEGVDGIVVRLDQPAFRDASTIHRHRNGRGGSPAPGGGAMAAEETVRESLGGAEGVGERGDGMRVMAGASLEKLVMHTATRGLSGIEALAGIPASIGGAIRMNAGGKFGAIADTVASVGCLTLDGSLKVYHRLHIDFDYRRCSIIDPVILWAELKLSPQDPKKTHARVKEIFKYKKDSQPMAEKSAGCAFKNPRSLDEPGRRVSAGQLIDRAGLKGYSIGGAAISERHANFFVAREGATADDLIRLMDHAAAVVKRELGYELKREVVVWRRSRKVDGEALGHAV